MIHSVRFSDRALTQLEDLEDNIALHAGSTIAENYIAGIIAECRSLQMFPLRGTPQPLFGAGMRSIPFRHRVTIFFIVDLNAIEIVGIYYGGRDFSSFEALPER